MFHINGARCPKSTLRNRFSLQETDEEAGVEAVHEAFRLGINFFDTSPLYGATRSETVSPFSQDLT